MTDRAVIGCAIACWIGARLAVSVPVALLAMACVALIVIATHPPQTLAAVFVVGVCGAVVTSALAAHAWGTIASAESGPWTGTATLASDPQPERGGVRVDLRIEGRRVQARAWGSAAGQLRARLLGEQVDVVGAIRRIDSPSPWFASRGVSATMTIESVGAWRTGRPHYRIANALRRTIDSGAASLSRPERSLLTGFVYGDDRFQDALTADSFRAAGLTHLLAVSGQNVAFVLVIAGPVLRRFGFRGRFTLTLLVLVVFATLTRFEPSVLRASLMAAVAALATVLGRPASSTRMLALAVVALVLVHPLIVHALAFQLSVAASVGILVISPWLATMVPGPRVFREAVAVTSGAQLAVAPLLITVFGGLPIASLPANVAAGPAAGPIMMWGLTAGTVAGTVREPLPFAAQIIHVPTKLLLGWVQLVADIAAIVPLGQLRLSHLAGLIVALFVFRHVRTPAIRRAATAMLLIVLVAPAAQLHFTAPATFAVDDKTTVWRDRRVAVVNLDPATDVEDLLAALRHRNVRRLDLVVTPGRRASFSQLVVIEERLSVGEVWAPTGHRVPGATTPPADTALVVGRDRLVLVDDDTRFQLEVVGAN